MGACIDLDRRVHVHEHNLDRSKFTSAGIPRVIVHKEYFETLQEAKNREAYVKRQKSKKYIESLIG